MESVRETRASSSNCARGWCWLGSIWLTWSSRSVASSLGAVRSLGMRAPSPLPSPLRRATADLLRQFPVGDGAAGGWIERRDGLAEGRSLREPDRARDHDLADLVPEVRSHLLGHLVGELRPGVVHHQDDG